MNLRIFTDGGSRGNPGIAGGGVIARSDDSVVFEKSIFFGQKTNNESEYLAFIAAVEWLVEYSSKNKLSSIEFFLDSKLVVEQVNKNWKIKEPRLRELANQVWEKLSSLPYSYKISHVVREKNSEADALANQAMDAYSE
jgi:ribonuclease HI